jgi:hypothetical protein
MSNQTMAQDISLFLTTYRPEAQVTLLLVLPILLCSVLFLFFLFSLSPLISLKTSIPFLVVLLRDKIPSWHGLQKLNLSTAQEGR